MNSIPLDSERADPRAARRRLWVRLAIDVAAPLIIFSVLRQFGVSILTASVICGAVPAIQALTSLIRGHVDLLGIAVVSLFAVGTVVSYAEGDPRFVFAKDGWLTGMLGIWVIISLATRRPFLLQLGRTIAAAKRDPVAADEWAQRWDENPRFRHDIQLASCVIGIVLMADAVVRVVIAYTVPLDWVPIATNIQYVVMLGGLLGWFFPFTSKRGLRA